MLARSFRPLRPAAFFVGVGLLAYAGCSSSAATSLPVTHPTMIEIAPDNFLGEVPCSTSGSGLKLFVATLFDANGVGTAGEGAGGAAGASAAEEAANRDAAGAATRSEPFAVGGAGPSDYPLPSSLPTPCRASVGFGFVVPGRLYRAVIDGYTEDELLPRAEGSRKMVIPVAGTPLAKARWVATCAATLAVDSTIVRAEHCTTFAP